jgi:cytochrome c-type biogenesis protein CcmH
MFWIVAGLLAAIVAWSVARPLLSGGEAPTESPDVALYRAQLAEVDRDLARGVLPEAEAERARTEIARRLLAADRAGPGRAAEAPRGATLTGVGVVAAVAVLGSLLVYALLGRPEASDAPRAARVAASEAALASRPSQAEAAASAPPAPEVEADPDYLAMVAQLREVVPTRPDDAQGWRLLALHEARLGRFAEAAMAQERVVALAGEEATAEDLAGLLDRMVAAADGLVSAEAEAVLARLLTLDPSDQAGRYYAGLLHLQTGRPDLAFPFWRSLAEEDPAGPYGAPAAAQISDIAWLSGRDWTPPPVTRGPSDADVAAAAEMDPEARAAMIEGMVASLGERLAAQGGSPEEWAQLVQARAALGDADGAAEALEAGRAAYAGDADALAVIEAAAP